MTNRQMLERGDRWVKIDPTEITQGFYKITTLYGDMIGRVTSAYVPTSHINSLTVVFDNSVTIDTDDRSVLTVYERIPGEALPSTPGSVVKLWVYDTYTYVEPLVIIRMNTDEWVSQDGVILDDLLINSCEVVYDADANT